ncbi:Asp-tRNA(Asn)/Glu-tRNA(Gln) amidotransferase subunit GatC [Candidatus Giovannonibacteria bacterium]|nr:Asp-tRNA(Asn)/Glu-tRNA(Gln) amidotransferase subunit GatC [Candidatus Giovannonibacteria bacterium]
MISKEEIKKLAQLARIHLTESEEKNLAEDLQNVLGYIEKLKEVDVSQAPEMTHATEVKNIFRADEPPKEVNEADKILLSGQFPESERGYLKVKGVFNSE